ncbi:unnamed protein product [Litomosoides sigmodontis]|uniref:Uncharacterized protein n=1 Tax=Litomosoides sigmodontis TaxID=42156 RepID=A0A3P6TIV4_LITSI|nr:unnamed protein product [Litomosoides sigmodontis]
MQSFDIESLIGADREENNGCSGMPRKTAEMETVKEAATTKAIAFNEFATVTSTTEVSTSRNSNLSPNLIKSEFPCNSPPSRPHPETSATASTTSVINPESKCLGAAFHAYPCVSGSKSQSQCASSPPTTSG